MREAGNVGRLKASPERVSVLIGLLGAMLAAMPGYMLLGDRERMTLMGVAIIVIALLAAVAIRGLSAAARRHVLRLCMQLVLMWVAGCVLMSGWHLLTAALNPAGRLPLWAQLLPSGMTLGVVMHVLLCWWQGGRRPGR